MEGNLIGQRPGKAQAEELLVELDPRVDVVNRYVDNDRFGNHGQPSSDRQRVRLPDDVICVWLPGDVRSPGNSDHEIGRTTAPHDDDVQPTQQVDAPGT